MASASAASSLWAWLCATASPAMMTGRSALASRSAAAATASASPRTRGATRVGSSRSISASSFKMSPGSDRNTGPVGGAFDERPSEPRQVGGQHRLGGEVFEVLLAGGDEHRCVSLHRVVEHAHGVAETGRDMKVQHREIAGGLGIAVGHRHQGCFLEAEDVADVVLDREGVHQRQFGGAGIAEHDRDTLLLEQIEKGAFSGHHGQVSLPSLVIAREGGRSSNHNLAVVNTGCPAYAGHDNWVSVIELVPRRGFEPPTPALRMRCSTG